MTDKCKKMNCNTYCQFCRNFRGFLRQNQIFEEEFALIGRISLKLLFDNIQNLLSQRLRAHYAFGVR